jgi:hypothetical protein
VLIGSLALTAAALFTGTAFYIGFAEQASRLGLDDRALLAEWKSSYRRGAKMAVPLVILGFLLGVVAWWQTGREAFLAGALLMVANGPWTLMVIMPTNGALMATRLEDAGPLSRSQIIKWNKLHSVRTVLGGIAILAFLIAV